MATAGPPMPVVISRGSVAAAAPSTNSRRVAMPSSVTHSSAPKFQVAWLTRADDRVREIEKLESMDELPRTTPVRPRG